MVVVWSREQTSNNERMKVEDKEGGNCVLILKPKQIHELSKIFA